MPLLPSNNIPILSLIPSHHTLDNNDFVGASQNTVTHVEFFRSSLINTALLIPDGSIAQKNSGDSEFPTGTEASPCPLLPIQQG